MYKGVALTVSTTIDRRGFGGYLSNDAQAAQAWRDAMNYPLADANKGLPRVILLWRKTNFGDRDDWSPRQVQEWLYEQSADEQDRTELQTLIRLFLD
jgi:hypothetical protein